MTGNTTITPLFLYHLQKFIKFPHLAILVISTYFTMQSPPNFHTPTSSRIGSHDMLWKNWQTLQQQHFMNGMSCRNGSRLMPTSSKQKRQKPRHKIPVEGLQFANHAELQAHFSERHLENLANVNKKIRHVQGKVKKVEEKITGLDAKFNKHSERLAADKLPAKWHMPSRIEGDMGKECTKLDHPYSSTSITGSHLLSLPWHMSVFDAELYAASCALQYAASLSPPPRVVSLAVDSQAVLCTIARPGYSYQASLLRDICKATSTLLLSGSAVQVGWTPSHTGITSNELANAAAKLAAEGNPPDDLAFPWSYSHLRSQIRGRLLQEWQVWHKPRDDFPFSPSTKLSAIFTLPRHAATRLFQMKLAASYLLGHPNWHRPEPGLCPRCEEEVETTVHAILRCPARQYARGSFPETLDLKSARYDATVTEILAKFVRRTLTAYPPGFTSPEDSGTPTPPSSPS